VSVNNGEQANATTFNTSFLSKEVDSQTIAKVDLNRAGSGTQITDAQQSINDNIDLLVIVGIYITTANQDITNGGTIDLSDKRLQVLKVTGFGGPVQAQSDPFSSTPADGTMIRLEGQSDTNTVKIIYKDIAGGAILNGDAVLKKV